MFAFGGFLLKQILTNSQSDFYQHKRRLYLLMLAGLCLSFTLFPLWPTGHAQQTRRNQAAPKSLATVATGATLKAGATAADLQQTCTLGCTATVPATGQVNAAISFQATATPANCTAAPTYEWNFGDGTPRANQQNTSHNYTSAGTYNWTLTTSIGTGSTMIDTVVGGLGEGNPATQTPFLSPGAIARDPQGRGIYVSEAVNNTYFIRFVNTSNATATIAGRSIAAGTVRTIAGADSGSTADNTPGLQADLGTVTGLAVGGANGELLFFTDSNATFSVRALNVSGSAQTVAGQSLAAGNVRTLASGLQQTLGGLAVGPNSDVYVTDATPGVNKVFRITLAGALTTVAGNGANTTASAAFNPGPATSLALLTPRAVELDTAGNLYIADSGHGRVIRVEPGGNATLVAQFTFDRDSPIAPYNNPPYPSGLAFFNGKLYIALGNAQNIVRMDGSTAVSISGTIASACNYTTSNCGDGGPLSGAGYSFNGSTSTPALVGLDTDANGLYVPDQSINGRGRVRYLNLSTSAVTLAGVNIAANNVDTVAGNGLSSPYDGGPATSARLFTPIGLAFDANNNLYIAEAQSGRLRFVNRGTTPITIFSGTMAAQTVQPGAITTINKDLSTGQTNDVPANQAGFTTMQGLAISSQGLYIVDANAGPTVPQEVSTGKKTGLIRFINTTGGAVTLFPSASQPIVVPAGNITTIAGGGSAVSSTGDGGFALNAKFIGPSDIAVAANGDIYIADVGHKAVRKINGANGVVSSLTLPSGSKQYTGVGLDPSGRLYITNFDDNRVLRETGVGTGSFALMDSGGLNKPRDVVADSDGNAYVVNSDLFSAESSDKHKIMRVAASGAVTTYAGTTKGFSGDGGAATSAQISVAPSNLRIGQNLDAPVTVGIVTGPAGQIFFSDASNNRIRRLSSQQVVCTRTGQITIAGENPVPVLSSISPTSGLAGTAAFTLTATGTGFVPSSKVRWNGQERTTTYMSATQLTAQITAADITNAGTAQVTVFSPTPGGGTTGAQTFTITQPNPVPTISSINPNSATADSQGFTLTVTGTNFVQGATVRWDGSPRQTTFVSATQLTAAILSDDLVGVGTAQVSVLNPTPGGGASNSLAFSIVSGQNPVPQLTNIDPTSRPAGSPTFALTVNGANFVASSKVRFSGADRMTTFVNSTQLQAEILASDLTNPGTAPITVFTPTPGGGVSSAQTFTITSASNPAPTLASLNPNAANAGSPAFTLTVTGTNFVNGSAVRWNGNARTTTFVSATQLTAAIPATDIASAGTAQVTIFNPTPGGGVSNAVTFTINQASNPTPTLTQLNPNTANAGGAAFTLTVTGTNFSNSSFVRWNGNERATIFVSATQLTAAITAADIANTGTAQVTVFNPAPGGGASNALTFTINQSGNPAPTLTLLNPNAAAAGGAAFTLQLTGTNFINGSIVRWNNSARTTTFVSATQLTAAIPATDIASVGTAQVTVFNPAPGGGTSSAQTFTITATSNPTPTLTQLNPNAAAAGGAGFTLTVTGTNFINGSVIRWNGSDRPTTFGSATQLTAAIPATDIASAGTAQITVFNPAPGGGASTAQTFTITPPNNPTPTLTALNPSAATAGGAAFTLTVTGTNFINGSLVRWNGQERATTFVSATQLTAAIPATDIASAGTAQVIVFNPAPGGGASIALPFTINQANNPAPTLTQLNPSTAAAGGAAFTLTVTGTNFINGSAVRWNGSARATTFVSATQLTAAITAADIASAGTAQVTVFNPTPGGGASTALTFTTNQSGNPTPTLTSLNPNALTAGDTAFTLRLTGTNFVQGAVVRWNGSDRTTGFVSATQLTADITATDLASAGTVQVTVFNPAPGGGVSNAVTFTINQGANPPPVLTSIDPNTRVAGSAAFVLTVTGSSFVSGARVRWNGSDRTTTFVSATRLTAEIPAADIANAGTARITVSNPTPGGGVSNEVTVTITRPSGALTNLSAASYLGQTLAPDSIVAAFGANLATEGRAALGQPLPTTLAGTTVKVRDSVGTERDAGIFFAAPGQVNYLIPADTALGAATVTITSGNGAVSQGAITIANIAPGVFTANSNGQGVPAAVVVRVAPDGAQTVEALLRLDPNTNTFAPLPIDLGQLGERVLIVAFGTGLRGRTALSNVTARLGGESLPVGFAGAQGSFAGLDQINIGSIPRSLIGRGNVELTLTVDGRNTNTVLLNIK